MLKVRWPWVEKIFVPIVDPDGRTWREKWSDSGYLKQVAAFGRNTVFITEVAHALGVLREQADAAKSNDELRGINQGIKALRNLLVQPELAKTVLNREADLDAASDNG